MPSEISVERFDAKSLLRTLHERKGREWKIAQGIQKTMRLAYSRVFEERNTEYLLPKGAIKNGYFNGGNPARVREQIERMTSHILYHGAVYWLGWRDKQIMGVAKTTPSRKAGINVRTNIFLRDIAVAEEGLGDGSRLMRQAIIEHPGDRKVVLDAFVGNDHANNWYERLGFLPLEPQPPNLSMEISGLVIPQVRMVAPIASVTRNLAG